MKDFKKDFTLEQIAETANENYKLLASCSKYLNPLGKNMKQVYSFIEDQCSFSSNKNELGNNLLESIEKEPNAIIQNRVLAFCKNILPEDVYIEKLDYQYSECERDEHYIGLYWEEVYAIKLKAKYIGFFYLIYGEDYSDYGDHDCIYIQWAELHKEYRGKGYFTKAIDCLKTYFRDKGKSFITFECNDDLLEMYQHLGAKRLSYDEFREMSKMRFAIGQV